MLNALFQLIVAIAVFLATAAQIEAWAIEEGNRAKGIHKQSWSNVMAWVFSKRLFQPHDPNWSSDDWEARRTLLERFSWGVLFLASLTVGLVNFGVLIYKAVTY